MSDCERSKKLGKLRFDINFPLIETISSLNLCPKKIQTNLGSEPGPLPVFGPMSQILQGFFFQGIPY